MAGTHMPRRLAWGPFEGVIGEAVPECVLLHTGPPPQPRVRATIP
jgi:hypothetical protein